MERVHPTSLQEAMLGKISSQDMMDQLAELLEEGLKERLKNK